MKSFAKAVSARVEHLSALAFTSLMLAPGVSMAQVSSGSTSSGGFAKGVGNITNLASVATTMLIAVGVMAGIGCLLFAGIQLYKKGGDRGDDIEWSKIAYAALGGAVCLALAYVGASSIELLGGSGGNINNGITRG